MTHGDHRQRGFEVPQDELADGFAAVMDGLDRLSEAERRDLEVQADCAVRGHEAYVEGLDLLERGRVDDARHRLHIALHHHVPGVQDALSVLEGTESAAGGPVPHAMAIAGTCTSLPVIPVLGDVRQAVREEAVGVWAAVTHDPASTVPVGVPHWDVVGTAARDKHLEYAEREQVARLASAPDAAGVHDQRQFREQLKQLRIARERNPLAQQDDESGSLDTAETGSAATASLVLNQDALPAWDFVAGYLDACGLTPTECLRWRRSWLELDRATRAVSRPGPQAPVLGEQGEDTEPGHDIVVRLLGQTAPTAGARARTKHPLTRPARRSAKANADARSSLRERPSWMRRLHHHSIAAACAALAVLAATWCLKPLHDQAGARQIEALRKQRCGTLNPTLVTRPDGECIGVTDGSENPDVFGSELRSVLRAMAAENSAVQAVPHVTVAFLAPLSSEGAAGGLTSDQYVDEIEGAYTAVEQANASDSTVKIRMVLANMGADERYWKDTVEQLKAERGLVAVTGMGSSRRESVQAARELSKAGIPMVADTVGADGFDTTGAIDGQGRINGLVQVGVTNRTLLAAAADDIAGGTRAAALVRMSGTADLYTQSLYRDFRTLAGLKEHLDPTAVFTFDPRGSLDVAASASTEGFCYTGRPIDTVYFAAPERYLPAFLTALSRRSCHAQPITVVTGPGTAGLSATLTGLHQLEAPITVLYPSLPDSEALSSSSNGDHALYRDFLRAFNRDHHGQTFHSGHATRDHGAVLAHDAVVTAAIAIRNATPAAGVPDRRAVLDRLYALTGKAVPGASGRFGIDPTTGNRTTTPVTTYRLNNTT
ncbi:ABC transporter substrate-binding protein [Streptomyces sp. NPDC059690]|uniref:ABC transporter substrate-binding protein n=1 Tax=Streptomyces sp. NPDC059690 TaxID=3346907 RepID=UPI0036ABD1F8